MEKIRKKVILVAGGAGFIGSNLCHRLVADGHNVICVDNLQTGFVRNIEDLRYKGNFLFHRYDISHDLDVLGVIDEIYNCACPASPDKYQSDPVQTLRTSVMGVNNLLELARRKHATLLQCSTSEVYGDPAVSPQGEDYWGNVNPNGIRSCYDEGKRCAETLCLDFHRQYGVPVKIIRIFNTYGPGMAKDDGRVVSNFIVQSLSGNRPTVYGDGSQTRSFQYIDDLIEGMVRVMATDKDFCGPINLGNPEEFTINDLVQKVMLFTGCRARVTHKPLPSDDPKRRRPDISLAEKIIGWKPKVGLDEGLEKTIEYFKTII